MRKARYFARKYSCGLAAGLHFAPEGDDAAKEVAAYARERGVKSALSTYSGINSDSCLAATVEDVYGKIAEKAKMSEIISSLQIY